MLTRWHPQAAAYLALCPQPVPELLSASEAVLRCRTHAEAYGVVLPPQTALDEVARASVRRAAAERASGARTRASSIKAVSTGSLNCVHQRSSAVASMDAGADGGADVVLGDRGGFDAVFGGAQGCAAIVCAVGEPADEVHAGFGRCEFEQTA